MQYPPAGFTCIVGSEEHCPETHASVWRRKELERQQKKEKQKAELKARNN